MYVGKCIYVSNTNKVYINAYEVGSGMDLTCCELLCLVHKKNKKKKKRGNRISKNVLEHLRTSQ